MQELEQENKDMDEDGEEFVAQKTRMRSIKLRGVVFRLQIHATNTRAPDQDKFNERRTGANLIGTITWAWAMGQDCRLRKD